MTQVPFQKLNRLEKVFQEISRLETGTFLENSCRLIPEATHENSTLLLILTSFKSPRTFLGKSSKSYFCRALSLDNSVKQQIDIGCFPQPQKLQVCHNCTFHCFTFP